MAIRTSHLAVSDSAPIIDIIDGNMQRKKRLFANRNLEDISADRKEKLLRTIYSVSYTRR